MKANDQNQEEALQIFDGVPKTADYYTQPQDFDADPAFAADYIKSQFVEEILQAMDAQNLSRTELAERLGKTKQYISRVLNETANFTIETMVEISHALGKRLVVQLVEPDKRIVVGLIANGKGSKHREGQRGRSAKG